MSLPSSFHAQRPKPTPSPRASRRQERTPTPPQASCSAVYPECLFRSPRTVPPWQKHRPYNSSQLVPLRVEISLLPIPVNAPSALGRLMPSQFTHTVCALRERFPVVLMVVTKAVSVALAPAGSVTLVQCFDDHVQSACLSSLCASATSRSCTSDHELSAHRFQIRALFD